MAKVAITEQYLEDIADAIREKTGLSDTYYPAEMAEAILSISGSGGIVPTGTISITENGTYNVTQYASASVSVSGETYPDGDNIGYGLTDGTLPIVGVAKVGSAHVWDDQLQMMIFGTGQIGTGRVV